MPASSEHLGEERSCSGSREGSLVRGCSSCHAGIPSRITVGREL